MPFHRRILIKKGVDRGSNQFAHQENNLTAFIYKNKTGWPVSILPGSMEMSSIANWMEVHYIFRMTTMLVNDHHKEQYDERVSNFEVMQAFYRLQSKIKIIEKNTTQWQQ